MENRFLKNKIIIKYCEDYYRIINERFNELDTMSDKVIQVYQAYIFSIDPKNKIALKKAITLNKALVRYFEDRSFKTEITKGLKHLKKPSETSNVIDLIVNYIVENYNKYLEGYTRSLYIPRWI